MSRVSVLVPLYNKAAYIGRCLESIVAQEFRDFEVVVMDDGSTDNSVEIAKSYTSDERIRILSQPNAGPGAARNRAAAESKGDLIACLDADDAWDPDYLSESVRLLDEYGPEVACLTWAMMEYPVDVSSAVRWKRAGMPEGRYRVTPETDAQLVVAFLANMLPSSTVIRRQAFEEAGGYYAKNRCLFSEDAYLWLKVVLRHAVAFDHRSPVRRYCDASELSMNLAGVRPVEPFLLESEDMYRDCPDELRELLRQVLTTRALKTASVYGYFGKYQQARDLFQRFATARDWRLPFFGLALLGCTPMAKWLGGMARLAGVNLRATNAA